MADEEKPHILWIEVNPESQKLLDKELEGATHAEVECDMEKLIEPVEPTPAMVFVGKPKTEVSLLELAQLLRMNYPDAPIFFIGLVSDGLDKKDLVKNGFNDAFLIPIDSSFMITEIRDNLMQIKSRGKIYKSVKLIDISPGTTLDFDTHIFMPLNKKYVRFSSAGDALSEERSDRLNQHKIQALHVSHDQMNKFYKYTANRLKELGEDNSISETERKEKMQGAVRNLMSDMFVGKSTSTTAGKEIVDNCQKVVSNYITNTPQAKWYSRILAATNEAANTYSHAGNVSTFAALFSMALSIGKPEDLALAGLLHDIGLAKLPKALKEIPEKFWTKEDREMYEKHPQASIDVIKDRKLVVPPIVQTAILQHHEKYNGSGFPAGLTGNKISPEAQVLALADRFDYLTALVEGQKRMTPPEAVRFLQKEAASDPSKITFDPKLLNELLKLFPSEEDEKKEAEQPNVA